jgi:hypothetical protein
MTSLRLCSWVMYLCMSTLAEWLRLFAAGTEFASKKLGVWVLNGPGRVEGKIGDRRRPLRGPEDVAGGLWLSRLIHVDTVVVQIRCRVFLRRELAGRRFIVDGDRGDHP